MKKFTIPCQFASTKAPFPLYIGAPRLEAHPMHYQAMWLSKERQGTVPVEVMNSFKKLWRIAIDNDSNFEELCIYALGSGKTTLKGLSDDELSDKVACLIREKQKRNAELEKTKPGSTKAGSKAAQHNAKMVQKRPYVAKADTAGSLLLGQNFDTNARLLYRLSERIVPDDAYLRAMLHNFMLLAVSNPGSAKDVPTLTSIYRQLCSDDSSYSLCVVLDTIGFHLPQSCHRMIGSLIFNPVNLLAVQNGLQGRLVDFAYNGAEAVNELPLKAMQQDLQKFMLS